VLEAAGAAVLVEVAGAGVGDGIVVCVAAAVAATVGRGGGVVGNAVADTAVGMACTAPAVLADEQPVASPHTSNNPIRAANAIARLGRTLHAAIPRTIPGLIINREYTPEHQLVEINHSTDDFQPLVCGGAGPHTSLSRRLSIASGILPVRTAGSFYGIPAP
jgi:hypothetical protein